MPTEPLSKLSLKKFTAFENLELEFSPGINVIIGKNATGKTHILKVLYAATKAQLVEGFTFGEKLVRVFSPADGRPGRLVKRTVGPSTGVIEVTSGSCRLIAKPTTRSKKGSEIRVWQAGDWFEHKLTSAYVPVKEMLAHAPGFRSLYATRAIAFDEVYADLIDLAYLPVLRGPRDGWRKKLLKQIEGAIDGNVVTIGEAFFLKDKHGTLEFTLLAEGLRKLALLWLLIQNGSLSQGHVLFWDEPETNLNPSLQGKIVEILLELQRTGVQVFLATHNYVLLKEFDLRMRKGDEVMFHALGRDEKSNNIVAHSTNDYLQISPNVIQDTYLDLYDRDVKRALGTEEKR